MKVNRNNSLSLGGSSVVRSNDDFMIFDTHFLVTTSYNHACSFNEDELYVIPSDKKLMIFSFELITNQAFQSNGVEVSLQQSGSSYWGSNRMVNQSILTDKEVISKALYYSQLSRGGLGRVLHNFKEPLLFDEGKVPFVWVPQATINGYVSFRVMARLVGA